MGSSITRRLLRDWKHLLRSLSHTDQTNESRFFLLKPQESNLHIWHLVLIDPSTSVELYFILYINESMNNQIIIARCLTPCDNFPFNKNIPLTHLFPTLKEHGFHLFVIKLWYICFGRNEDSNEDSPTSNCPDHITNSHVSRMLKAWNRIVYKDFKLYFPELVGFLQPGDYELVKALSKRLKEFKYDSSSYSKTININPNKNVSQVDSVSNTHSINIHNTIHNQKLFYGDKTYLCDNIASLKRTRLSLEDIKSNYEENCNAYTSDSKRRRV
ncbi:ubiquitin-conjugating enzyme suppressor 1 [Monosporozyma unispora]|nr:hypothetical protein C6P44_003538 [Kazachstania unispora]